jgi:hypothetical protein
MTFYFEILARPVGAIGERWHDNKQVEAPDYDAAVRALYETHEHISVNYWAAWDGGRCVATGPNTQRGIV